MINRAAYDAVLDSSFSFRDAPSFDEEIEREHNDGMLSWNFFCGQNLIYIGSGIQ